LKSKLLTVEENMDWCTEIQHSSNGKGKGTSTLKSDKMRCLQLIPVLLGKPGVSQASTSLIDVGSESSLLVFSLFPFLLTLITTRRSSTRILELTVILNGPPLWHPELLSTCETMVVQN
jgi:hypothetical protein